MNPRLTAGVGVLCAFLLLGGAGAAVALADPGGSHGSGRDNSSSGDGGSRHDRGDDRRGNDGNDRRGPKNNNDRGNRPDFSADGGPGGGHGSDNTPPARGHTGSPPKAVEPIRGNTPDEDTPNEQTPRPLPSAPSVNSSTPPAGGNQPGPGGGGSGGGSQPVTVVPPESPRVTSGSGRTRNIDARDHEPRWQAPAPVAVAPPPPPPPPVTTWVERVYTQPAVVRQFVVAPAVDFSDPVWGLAGLVLIPAAGAVLGYRQARANRAAERLGRS